MHKIQDKYALNEAFTRSATWYNTLVGMSPGYASDLRASAMLVAGTRKVLDLCCGTGLSTMAVASVLPEDSEITGVDMSEGMLAIAKATVRPPYNRRVTWVQGDAMHPYWNAPFDGVFCAYGLRNFPADDRLAALQRIRNVIRPGGMLVIHDYSLPADALVRLLWTLMCWAVIIPLGWLTNRGDASLYTYLWRSVLDFLTPKGVQDLLHRAGFTVTHAAPVPSLVGGLFTWTFVARRL